MKTHLPVALRKALLAAIFAVSFGVYNAHAAEPEQTTPSPVMVTYDNISSANQSLSASGDTGIRVEAVTDTADNLTITTQKGDVEIGTIQSSNAKQVDAVTITTGGSLSIGESGVVSNIDGNDGDPAFVTNANIKTGGDFTVGTTAGAENVIVFCGTQVATSEVKMDIGGSFIALQSVDIRPGGGSEQSGDAYINIGGDALFLGETASVLGGGDKSTAEAHFTAEGMISMNNQGGATVGHGATLTANGGSITINSGDNNEIAGNLIASDKVSITGICNTIVQNPGLTVNIRAQNGVSVVSTSEETFGNWLQNAAVYTDQGGVKMTTESMHYVYFSSIQAESGDVEILDGGIDVNGSTVQADAGKVSMNGDSVSVIDSAVTASGQVEIAGSDASGDGTGLAHVTVTGQSINIGHKDTHTSISAHEGGLSTLDAGEDINVIGSAVAVADDTSIDSTGGNIAITATIGQVSVAGGNVTSGQGEVSIGGATETRLAGVEVSGASVAVGSGTGSTTIGSEEGTPTTIDASGNITVKDKAVTFEENSVITSAQGNIEIAATDSDLSVTGGSVTTGQGTIAINGATSTTVSGAEVGIAEGSDAVVAVEIGQPGAGTTTIDGTTVNASGHVKVDGASVEIKNDSDIVSSDGDVTIAATGYNELSGDAVTATTGIVTVTSGATNTIAASVTAGADVEVTAGENNTITGDVTAGSTVEITAAGNNVVSSDIAGGTDVTIATTGGNNELSGDIVTATTGTVTVSADAGNTISAVITAGADVEVTAGENNTITGDMTASNTVEITAAGNNVVSSDIVGGADVTIATTGGNNELSGDTVTATAGTVTVSADAGNTISAVVTAGADVEVTAGENNTITGDVTAGNAVEITAAGNNAVSSDIVGGTDVAIATTGGNNELNGGIVTATNGAISLDAGDAGINQVNGATLDAQHSAAGGADDSDGTIAMTGSSNEIIKGASLQADAGVSISSTGTGLVDCNGISASSVTTSAGDIAICAAKFNTVAEESEIEAESGNVSLAGSRNRVLDSTVTAGADVTMGAVEGSSAIAQNVVLSSTGEAMIKAAGSVSIQGMNSIYRESNSPSEVSIIAEQGDIDVSGSNLIDRASLQAGGAVRITTGEGNMTTTVENSSLVGSSVVVAGDTASRSDADMAEVSGADTLVEAKSITLNNVSVVDTGKGTSNIRATEGGDISILDRVDLANATLTSAGRIVVDTGHVLNARAASGLDGNLVGEGDINKSGGDALQLSGDNTGFNGSIYVNGAEGGAQGSVVDADNAGSWLEISGAGVGSASAIVLKNTDLLVNSSAAQIGTLDTTQDAVANNVATGGTLQADGSYTADANTRTDFGNIGSVVELNQGTSGDVLQASQLKLSDATLLKLDSTVDAAGNASSDTIQVAGDIDLAAARTGNKVSPASAPATARVFITHHGDAANAADGARTTILQGNMASDINEDVLYDVALSENCTYQRTLQDRNVHLENKGDHVDLVYSKNYRSAAKDAHLSAVADAMKELSDSFHHTEGTLAASADTMKRLVDAFDYTRSEDAALRGLKSVAGTGNVLPRLMQFDSSRRHLSALRQQMEMPVCKYAWKGALNRTNNVWMSYTGAYDNLSGDSNMGDYTRNAQGAIVGVDRSLSCKLRVGLSLGYETGTGEADSNSVDADTFFVDAYATGVTGYFKHRASVGLATTSFDTERNVLVEAGYHTFNGPVKGCADGLTLNFGYEISSDYQFSERSRITRYLAVNLAWHKLDSVKEEGLGAVGLTTEFEDEWQADLALGVNYVREFAALRNQKLASFYANAAVHLELLNDQVTANNRLGDTGDGWQTSSMERSSLYFELGAGVMVPLSPTWTGTAGATFEIGPDRYGFSGGIGARYSF